RFSGRRFATIMKGRREKREQTRRKDKVLTPLPHMVERYMHVFKRAGFSADSGAGPWMNPDTRSRQLARDYLNGLGLKKKENYWIGIAPFAGHGPKMWPLEKMRELLEMMRRGLDVTVFLFGGGSREIAELEKLRTAFPDAHIVAGKLTLEGEIGLMMKLDLMIAMDSFNMHMGALLAVPILSIWGATHPYSGFGPYGQDERSIVQIPVEKLPCRPCSVFGNKKCFRGDLACLNWITPKEVYDRLLFLLGQPASGEEYQPQTD
ncbi:MAG: glycosyltransferase family 9 protein, partial [Spirochaetia bacterium]|nr:glycosyltransferase family 9 protein [Spirochaetia bacterium]